MKISREELKELNKKGRVEIQVVRFGKEYCEELEVEE